MDSHILLDKKTKKYNYLEDDIKLYKMTFIYEALLKGWKVKMIHNNRFEFTTNNKDIKQQYFLHDFLENFVKSNIH